MLSDGPADIVLPLHTSCEHCTKTLKKILDNIFDNEERIKVAKCAKQLLYISGWVQKIGEPVSFTRFSLPVHILKVECGKKPFRVAPGLKSKKCTRCAQHCHKR